MKRILQLAAIVFLTVFFLYLFLRNSDLAEVWRLIRSTNPYWFATGLLINFAALIFRTWRWRLILDERDPPPFYPTFFANTVGYMLSTVLPVRAADVARPALLARRTEIRFSGALGTVLTERILDLYSLLLLFIYFTIAHWDAFSLDPRTARSFFIIKSGAVAAAVILAVLSVFIAGLFFFRGGVRRAHEFLGRILPRRFRGSWMHFFDAFTETLRLARQPRALGLVMGCTAGIWFCLTSQFWFVTLALHRPLPFDSSFFVTGVTTVGLAIPTPGGIGGFHKACQIVLTTFYRFDIDSSVAVALLFHVVGTAPVVISGLALFVHEGLRWRDVASAAEEKPPADGL
ncbi:MAG TPA: lysylphosphatidylglycerol synthase transmembrane domain-containing protein [Thermoanaerobaculia bacterium]|nr:lysylphosphatidylglycerol synthase transmembrane domain-containing protein [Thermoanaerobaculia bacterium]